MFRASDRELPPPWQEIFGPLRRGSVDGLVVVGQFGQSIDARIATTTGDSRYINGAAGLAHLHRLRALVDAVLIGVGTAIADDPQLTVRRVAGPSPARVILDPNGRLPPTARVLAADGIRRLLITRESAPRTLQPGVETAALPASGAYRWRHSRRTHRTRLSISSRWRRLVRAFARLPRPLHVVIAPIIIKDHPERDAAADRASRSAARSAPMFWADCWSIATSAPAFRSKAKKLTKTACGRTFPAAAAENRP
jgi:hypothetical protein